MISNIYPAGSERPVFVDGTMVGIGPRVVVEVADGNHEVFAVINGRMAKMNILDPRQRKIKLR